MNLKKIFLSIFLVFVFSTIFSAGFFETTQAADDYCKEKRPGVPCVNAEGENLFCTENLYCKSTVGIGASCIELEKACKDSKGNTFSEIFCMEKEDGTHSCQEAYNAVLGETCTPNDYLEEGDFCADESICDQGKCKEPCTKNYSQYCDTYEKDKGRCYPMNSNPQISVCQTTAPSGIGSFCGTSPESKCFRKEIDTDSEKLGCPSGMEEDFTSDQLITCSPTPATDTEPEIDLSCCRPSDDLIDGKKRCLGDEYGEKCLGGDAYCYNEICEP
nr:hypothetical protein [Patescibacteria group bacterium]